MSPDPSSRAAELAARQVEAIVASAEAAAQEILAEARRESAEMLEVAERDAERLRDEGRRDAEAAMERARRAAEKVAGDARAEAERRVTEAQRAADEALEDARVMSHGLRRLGAALGDQADRILRDVQAAHKRLSADLRIASGTSSRAAGPGAARAEPAASEGETKLTAREAEALTRLAERERAAAGEEGSETQRLPRPRRGARREGGTPIDDFEVPTWVEPGS